jgi:renalase
MTQVPRTAAVIGAGIAGLACARQLQDAGVRVLVVDKARGAGGRMTTRRRAPYAFDHGAQYFTAHGPAFRQELRRWLAAGSAAPWSGSIGSLVAGQLRLEETPRLRFVGTPGMSAIGRQLAGGLSLQLQTRIAAVAAAVAGGWQLRVDGGAAIGPFDAVAVAAPAPQAAPLLAAAPALAARVARVDMAPCIAALAAFAKPVACAADGVFVKGPALAWAARNGSKPGRPVEECWVLHGTATWSRTVLEDEPAAAARRLLEDLATALGGSLPALLHCDAHRWRHALPETPIGEACLWDPDLRLGACGDWCLEGRVEGAFDSGRRLAQRMSATDGSAEEEPVG